MFYKKQSSNYSNNINGKRNSDSGYYKIKKYFIIPSLIAGSIFFSRECNKYPRIEPNLYYEKTLKIMEELKKTSNLSVEKTKEAINKYNRDNKLLEGYEVKLENFLKETEGYKLKVTDINRY